MKDLARTEITCTCHPGEGRDPESHETKIRALRLWIPAFAGMTIALTALILFSIPASAVEKKPVDYRRTLFVSVGQKRLALEAPPGMCFLDQSNLFENAIYMAFRSVVQERDDQVLLAVFTSCEKLANLGLSHGTSDIPLNAGTISWMNPSIGETTALERREYLDMREAFFHEYVGNTPPARGMPHLDTELHRTEAGVSLGMSGDLNINNENTKSSAMMATTSIRHIPLEVMIRHTGHQLYDLEKIRQQMDQFMAQQIALNE